MKLTSSNLEIIIQELGQRKKDMQNQLDVLMKESAEATKKLQDHIDTIDKLNKAEKELVMACTIKTDELQQPGPKLATKKYVNSLTEESRNKLNDSLLGLDDKSRF